MALLLSGSAAVSYTHLSVPATNTMIRRMIKETDGDHFEDLRSLEQNLTFQAAKKEFEQCKVTFGAVSYTHLDVYKRQVIDRLFYIYTDLVGIFPFL